MTHRSNLSTVLAVLVVLSLVGIGGVAGAAAATAPTTPADLAEESDDEPELEAAAVDGGLEAPAATSTHDAPADEASPTYRIEFEADGVYSFGVPGPTDQTVGEAFVGDLAFDGVVYAYDARADRWRQVAPDDEVDALDAFVVVADEHTAAVLEFADGDGDAPSTDLGPGLNHVAAPQQAAVDDAFAVEDAAVEAVVDPESVEHPSVSPGQADDFDRVDADDGATVDPFAGYFVAVNESDDDGSLATVVEPGQDHEAANDALGVDSAIPEPYFEVDLDVSTAENSPDATHELSVDVTNVGPAELTQTVVVEVAGEPVTAGPVTLAPGETRAETELVDLSDRPIAAPTVAAETPLDRDETTVEVPAERTVDGDDLEPGDTVEVTLGGETGELRTLVVTERFADDVENVSLESVTVDGQSATPTVTNANEEYLSVVLEDVAEGDLEVTYEFEIPEDHVPGEPVDFDDSELVLERSADAAGESVGLTGDEAVELAEPPALDAEIVDADVTSVAGERHTVTVDAEHVGTENGTSVVTFDYGDGLSEQHETFELAPGENTTATFEVDTTAKPIGTHSIAVDGGASGDTANATILPERSLETTEAPPGATVNATLDAVVVASDTVVFNERYDGPVADAEVQRVRIDGEERRDAVTVTDADGEAVTVVLDDVEYGPVAVDYELTLADDAAATDEVAFETESFAVVDDAYGNPGEEIDVGGDVGIDVTSDEAYFAVTDLRPDGETIEVGDSVPVEADLHNVGGADGAQNVTYTATNENDSVVAEEAFDGVAVGAGNETTVDTEFDASGLAPGDYELTVETEDDAATATVTVGEEAEPVGEVAGEITADVVPPSESLTVEVALDGTNHSDAVTLTAEDASASYAIADVPADENYTVVAEADDAYADDVETNVTVADGETADVDLAVQRLTGDAELSVVANESGDAIASATAELAVFGDENHTLTADADANGTVAFDDLPVGEHEVDVEDGGHEGASATVEVAADDTVEETVSLTALQPATFQVDDVRTDAVEVGETADVEVDVENTGDRDGTTEVTLDVGGAVFQNDTASIDAGDAATVPFAVDTSALGAGEHDVLVATDDDSAEATLDVADDEPETGAIAGEVALDPVDPDENVTVTVEVDETGDQSTVELDGADATGDYAVEGLAADENYTVVASATNYEDATADVAVAANDTASADLALQRQTGDAEVTVVDDDGDAVEDATLEVAVLGDENATETAATDANGTAAFADLPVGEHELVATHDQHEDDDAVLAVDADATVTETVELDALDPHSLAVSVDDVDDDVTVGDVATVEVTVTNQGDLPGDSPLTVEVGEAVELNDTVSLAGGESTTETVEVDTAELGAGEHDVLIATDDDSEQANLTVVEPEPGELEIEVLDAEPAAAGGELAVEVAVENVGQGSATHDLTASLGGAAPVEVGEVSLAGGEAANETVTLDVPDDQPIGDVEVAVFTADDNDTATATVAPERSLASDTAAPGDTVEVTVTAELGAASNASLVETFDQEFADATLTGVEVDGNGFFPDVGTADGEGAVVSTGDQGPGTLVVTYEVTLPDDAADGATYGYEAENTLVELDGEALPVVGDDGLTVDA